MPFVETHCGEPIGPFFVFGERLTMTMTGRLRKEHFIERANG